MNTEVLPRSLSFLAGAAAGLALGYYLHSEKGSALRNSLSEQLGETLEGLGEQVQDQLSELIAVLGDALEKGLGSAEGLQQAMQENLSGAVAQTKDALEDAEESFEHGMDKAKTRLLRKFAEAGV